MLKNGRPYSNENGEIDDKLITERTKEEIDMVCDWIKTKLNRIKTPNYEKTSYGLKHILQRDTGLYLTNNEFKDAMLLCGYEPANPNTINWNYCISKRSPAFIHN